MYWSTMVTNHYKGRDLHSTKLILSQLYSLECEFALCVFFLLISFTAQPLQAYSGVIRTSSLLARGWNMLSSEGGAFWAPRNSLLSTHRIQVLNPLFLGISLNLLHGVISFPPLSGEISVLFVLRWWSQPFWDHADLSLAVWIADLIHRIWQLGCRDIGGYDNVYHPNFRSISFLDNSSSLQAMSFHTSIPLREKCIPLCLFTHSSSSRFF